MMAIDKAKFCLECAYQGYYFGVSPHYLAAIGQLRSSISDGPTAAGMGPFGLSATEWAANQNGGAYQFGFIATDISDWRLQVVVFAYITQQTQSPAQQAVGHPLNSIEMYLCQVFGPGVAAKILTSPNDAVANAALATDLPLLQQRFPGLSQGTGTQTIADLDASLTSALNATAPFITQAILDLEADQHNFVGTTFDQKAPQVMKQLIADFNFKAFQAAGILGNLGHESVGFQVMQEVNPIGGGRGGYGWAQWTGGRRDAFQGWCQKNGVSMDSDAGNYGFLREELLGSEKAAVEALLETASLEVATEIFEKKFERAGVDAYTSRIKWARRAMLAYQQV
jgi:hypothetical protein